MPVIVKNINLPTSCTRCFALDDNGDYPRCNITGQQMGYRFNAYTKRMHGCPLVDADETCKEFYKRGRLDEAKEVTEQLKQVLKSGH